MAGNFRLRMGAQCGTMPVELDGKHYLVVVEKPTARPKPQCRN